MEAQLTEHEQEIDSKRDLILKLDSEVSTLRKEVLEKQNVIENLLSIRRADANTVDSKILYELQDTQRESELITSQLAEHQQDQSQRLLVERRVLEALTQVQLTNPE